MTTIKQIPPIPTLTDPLALWGTGDEISFRKNAARNVKELSDMGVGINEVLIPGINAIVEPVNSVLDNLQNIHDVPKQAAAAADSAEHAAQFAGEASKSAATAENFSLLAQKQAEHAKAIVSKITPALEADITTVADLAWEVAQVGGHVPVIEAALKSLPTLEALGTENIGKIGAISEDIVACAENMGAILTAPEHAASASDMARRAAASAASASAVSGLPVIAPAHKGKAMCVSGDGASWVLSEVSVNLTAKRARFARLNQLLGLGI